MRNWPPKTLVEGGIGTGALIIAALGPVIFNDYWIDAILTQTLILGIAAASLIFLSAYGGMISLAQTALMGIAAYMLGNMVTQRGLGGESKGLTLGWDPTVGLVLAIVITTALGLVFGALASRSFGIYFLMLTLTFSVIANYFFGQVTQFGGFSPIAGINRYTPGFVGDILNDRHRLYYIALIVAIAVYLLVRYIVRTPFGYSLQGVRDEPVRMASLGYAVGLHRTLAFGLAAFIASLAGVLYVWWQGQIAPQDVGLGATIDLLIVAVLGGLGRIEAAWLGAFAFIVMNNYVRDIKFPGASEVGELPLMGGSFNTIIGLIFLAIVIISPDGLAGLWERMWGLTRRRGGPDRPAMAASPAGQKG
jgi:branched-chain amino acid transport system permease protein